MGQRDPRRSRVRVERHALEMVRYRATNKTVFSAKYHVVRRECPRLHVLPCMWSPSWFVSTVGGAPLYAVRRYVESQKQAA
jgi:REP element-mobilizing transposase RayT